MSTNYISITAIQRPFTVAVDEQGRTVFSCNYEAVAWSIADHPFEGEVMSLIVAAGLGTIATDLFYGPNAPIPTGDGPYTTVIDTGGTEPAETHGDERYENLSFQVLVQGLSTATARTRANLIWDALDGVQDTLVTAA